MSRLAAMRGDSSVPGHIVRAREEFTGRERPEIVLAFDQSFSATGWALVRFGHGPIQILACGTIKTSSSLTGAAEDIDRAMQVAGEVDELWRQVGMATTKVRYETPPKGGQIRNPEVSLMAALAVCLTVTNLSGGAVSPEPVSAKAWKKMATGNANLKAKKVAHDAVSKWGCVEGFDLAKNESQRDAVMVALASQWSGAR